MICAGGTKGPSYPFGIMGMANKIDCLQKGELVKFQTCLIPQTGQKMACNVVPQRRALVECVKDQVVINNLVSCFKDVQKSPGSFPNIFSYIYITFFQFGFITYEVGDSKKLFFHVKEVHDNLELQTGDEVEFSVVFNQRTGKCSACNVRRVR